MVAKYSYHRKLERAPLKLFSPLAVLFMLVLCAFAVSDDKDVQVFITTDKRISILDRNVILKNQEDELVSRLILDSPIKSSLQLSQNVIAINTEYSCYLLEADSEIKTLHRQRLPYETEDWPRALYLCHEGDTVTIKSKDVVVDITGYSSSQGRKFGGSYADPTLGTGNQKISNQQVYDPKRDIIIFNSSNPRVAIEVDLRKAKFSNVELSYSSATDFISQVNWYYDFISGRLFCHVISENKNGMLFVFENGMPKAQGDTSAVGYQIIEDKTWEELGADSYSLDEVPIQITGDQVILDSKVIPLSSLK